MKSRKEVNHSYYVRKVKPFRKKKQPVGYHSFVCPICKRRSFMRNLKYSTPFSVDMVYFRGDRGIKWFRGVFDKKQKELIVELIKLKLISVMQEFGITAEDLGIKRIEFREVLPYVEIINQKSNINQRLEIPLRQEV